ncbi:branched-chain amino acid ABC transporter permease [Nisaea nitritireducens]|uniref:branched-chain amino acid ABC transporter permease n=1 Tax=Nisaea nitritireducens TaxID=568392 RepID=UPI001D0145AF|nr:branched-chain amino acid ABC transporter permease [Nisaea nitritireducens]
MSMLTTMSTGNMQRIGWAVLIGALLAAPFAIHSGRWMEFIELTLFAALLGQGWNILGGYGGQYSFGHALFFGTAAYLQALLQYKLGWSPWLTLWIAIGGSVAVAAFVGFLSFRYGLRGSYFALVTLAFAEAFHVLSRSLVSVTEGGRGVQLPLNQDPEQALATFQFTFAGPFLSEAGYYYTILIFLLIGFAVTGWLNHSRFGAQLQAVREDEDAASALGIDPFRVKMSAICLSAGVTSLAGIYYVQKFLFVDPGIAYGPGKSVEALFAAIIGGVGTVLGPLLGSAFIHIVGEFAKETIGAMLGDRPGVDLILFGIILVLMLAYMPRGLVGLVELLWRKLMTKRGGGNA